MKKIYGNNVYDFCPLSVTLCSCFACIWNTCIECIPELRYSMRSSPHHLEFRINMIFTVSNNINRRDTTITSGCVLYCRERCTFHYEMEFPLY